MALSRAGFSDLIAWSAAVFTSCSTSATIAFSSVSVAISSATMNDARRVIRSTSCALHGNAQRRGAGDPIALGFRRALVGRLVQLLVVGQRVGVGADYFRVNQRRSLSRPSVAHGLGDRPVAAEEVPAR